MGRRCRGPGGPTVGARISSTPQPHRLGMDSHIPSAPGVLSALRLHRMMTFGFRQLSFPLRHRHWAGCFQSEKWEVHYLYGRHSGASGQFSSSVCKLVVCVGMGQDVVSFVPVTLRRATNLFLCSVQHHPLCSLKTPVDSQGPYITLTCIGHCSPAFGTLSLKETKCFCNYLPVTSHVALPAG